MAEQNDKQPFNLDAMEKWLENFFLDPLTSYLDQTAFRVDLFETDTAIIVEAFLPGYSHSHLSVFVNDHSMTISANNQVENTANSSDVRMRRVDFPFSISDREILAVFQNGILEVFISKKIIGKGKNRHIPIT